jgi:hypothetical protein
MSFKKSIWFQILSIMDSLRWNTDIEFRVLESYTSSLKGSCVLKISPELFRIISEHLRAKLVKSNEKSVGMEEFWLDKRIASESDSAWNSEYIIIFGLSKIFGIISGPFM